MYNSEKKSLYFYYYLSSNDRVIRTVHLTCIRRYVNVFDEAKIFIAVDTSTDDGLIYELEKDFLDLGFRNIEFKVVPNKKSREAEYYFSEIIDKRNLIEGAVFFCHNKGTTNLDFNEDSISNWIMSMYYLNLENQDQVNWAMFYADRIFAGAYKYHSEDVFNKYHFILSGTFMWIHPKQLDLISKSYNIELPSCTYANSAENMPGWLPSSFTYSFTEESPRVLDLYQNCLSELQSHVSKDIFDNYVKVSSEWKNQIMEHLYS